MPWKAIRTFLEHPFPQRKALDPARTAADPGAASLGIQRAYAAGDYQAALAATEGLKIQGKETEHYCFYQGALRRHLGQPAEAERWLRKALSLTSDPRSSALQAEALGEALIEAGRYEDARRAFEQSLQWAPERGSSDRGIAESWLRQGEELRGAKARAELAVQKQRGWAAPGETAELNLGEDLALLAWAIASNEPDARRVTSLAVEAVAMCPPEKSVPSAAQVRFHLGCAYAMLGDDANSRQHYLETARLDRQGHWGASAAAVITVRERA